MFKLIDDWLDGIAGRNGLFRIAAGELDCRYKRLVLDLDGCAYDISGIVRAFSVYDRSDCHVFVILWNISRYDYFTFARKVIVCQSGEQMADIYKMLSESIHQQSINSQNEFSDTPSQKS